MDDNLKDFAVSWILIGILFISLITFSVSFIVSNSPGSLGDDMEKLTDYQSSLSGDLEEVSGDTNALLNTTALTNPEKSYLGSKESVSTSFSITGSAKKFAKTSRLFLSYVFTGTSGQLLASVFGGMFGLLSIYFITKWVRNGV